jgi:hypothetical protein
MKYGCQAARRRASRCSPSFFSLSQQVKLPVVPNTRQRKKGSQRMTDEMSFMVRQKTLLPGKDGLRRPGTAGLEPDETAFRGHEVDD